jgi:glycosyltransferase involved in cell wall biosynthesis
VNWPATCAVVIPCCNEEAAITGLVREVRRHLPTVIVVDDGSEDKTAARAAAAGAQIVRREGNPGKGAALKAGVAAALAQHYTWVITLDGDGQHWTEDIPAFLRCAEATGAALIVGNRMHQAEAIPWLRRRVNRWMSRRISACAGRVLPDSQCGFRLIDLKAWAAVPFEADHFEIESEVLLGLVRAGYGVEFVPIRVIGKGRQSHIHPLKDSWRWLWWWRRARLPQARNVKSERTNERK